MRCVLLCLLAIVALPRLVDAGPWAREPGRIFTSVTSSYRYDPQRLQIDSEGGFYMEYGLRSRLTLGVDTMDSSGGYSHLYAFARWPLVAQDRPFKMAFTLGAGASRSQGQWGPMISLGFSVGRGVNLWRPGWWTVTTKLEDHQVLPNPVMKLDATFGLNLGPRLKSFLEVETSHRRGTDPSIGVRVSLAWKMRNAQHLIIGLENKHAGTRSYGVRAGIWRSF
ncbi:hypothetical protein [Aestuariivita sp.]|jgi:hypothetical protein|uniref:hypothetical protein n=1 Tax=Aestuariivita sp. TaxID=1872407 RepID=UPI00216EDE96|nr:hypothetical protein [Aestuariivita sp.]MCE8008414.1 hypothetical protein [Aestuariivita sp.]